MSKVAFVFPGQGSQYVGMLKEIFEKYESAKLLVQNANEVLGFDISKIMFEGPVDSLKLTDITQPAIFIHSLAILNLLNKIKPDMAAGHSLGEYSALVSAASLDFESGLKLVRLRGQAMLEAGIKQQGTMAAIVGLSNETVIKICEDASSEGIVQCANFNSPGQIVISGSVNGVRKAIDLAKLNKAKLAKELVVSGAFHSPLMESAKEKLLEKLNETEFKNSEFPVYANVTAKPVCQDKEIKELLFQQLTNPVRWEETIQNMINDGAKTFYEIGPGKVLQGLIKRINPSVEIFGIDTLSDFERFI
ncbi:MAG: [acyl-carrier-protein] S-malonyltransferase [Ignavibacteriales bacterium CG_4_9_14_3_um_filter_34_10]|nr:MAG: [acyl-carrier-protein] S-malonyltransferase [Caldiserica bacterium CG17_big_fil_post_rev_8_21_14_2_50_35_7]PJA96573.1 MAG: [acyl-carrier-protein] S-malonyltransferase [Ignavibacteriales bacterium CG_4_9_14_3_um_filter_34_10]